MTRFTCFTAVVLLCMPFAVGKNNNLTLEQTVTLCNALKQFRGLKDAVRDLKYWITTESLKISNAKTRSDEQLRRVKEPAQATTKAKALEKRARLLAANVTEAVKKAEIVILESDVDAGVLGTISSAYVPSLEGALKKLGNEGGTVEVKGVAKSCNKTTKNVTVESLIHALEDMLQYFPAKSIKRLKEATRDASNKLYKLEGAAQSLVKIKINAEYTEFRVREAVTKAVSAYGKRYNLTLQQTQALCIAAEQYRALPIFVSNIEEISKTMAQKAADAKIRSDNVVQLAEEANEDGKGKLLSQRVRETVTEIAEAAEAAEKAYRALTGHSVYMKSVAAAYAGSLEKTLLSISQYAASQATRKAAEACRETAEVVTPKSLEDTKNGLFHNIPAQSSKRLKKDTAKLIESLTILHREYKQLNAAMQYAQAAELKLNRENDYSPTTSPIAFASFLVCLLGTGLL